VLQHGELVESGTHAKLMAQGGIYRTLFDLYYGSHVGADGAGQ
jgi:ABC-type multidrug transport system fused ATPase/permease subunit